MNLERIAEIEAWPLAYPHQGGEPYHCVGQDTMRELCRLARLGLRVEGAPTCSLADVNNTVEGLRQFADVIASLDGKRVALVVLEDAK